MRRLKRHAVIFRANALCIKQKYGGHNDERYVARSISMFFSGVSSALDEISADR